MTQKTKYVITNKSCKKQQFSHKHNDHNECITSQSLFTLGHLKYELTVFLYTNWKTQKICQYIHITWCVKPSGTDPLLYLSVIFIFWAVCFVFGVNL